MNKENVMKYKKLFATLGITVLLVVSGYGLYQWGMMRGMGMVNDPTSAQGNTGNASPEAVADPSTWSIPKGEEATRRHIKDGLKAGDVDPITGKKILYYHDPMVPGKKFPAPAKSPFMDMMLVPAYGGVSGDDTSQVSVSPRIQQNLGLRTALVVQGTLSPQVTAVGSIAWNERDQAVVQARATGFVEKLYARATLDRVAQGQALAELYVPDWVAAQEEYLALRHMQGADLAPLRDAARARMRQAGMAEEHIAIVEKGGMVQARITLRAPISGVLTEVMAREGMTVMAGATLYRINASGTVWAQAEVPESQAAMVRPGTKVKVTSPAMPGEIFEGRVQALVPEVNPATRTLKARMELANRKGLLVPGMFVQMQFMDMRQQAALLIPAEAVIQTGKRAVVMVAEENGKFSPVEIEVGMESGGQTEVRRGLVAGQRVVVSSQFLIDSEASLKGIETRLGGTDSATPGSKK
jgi:membrane fusion protein, copper/silver efflux system